MLLFCLMLWYFIDKIGYFNCIFLLSFLFFCYLEFASSPFLPSFFLPVFEHLSFFNLLSLSIYIYLFFFSLPFTIFNVSLYFLSCNSKFFLKSHISNLAKELWGLLSLTVLRALMNEYRRVTWPRFQFRGFTSLST